MKFKLLLINSILLLSTVLYGQALQPRSVRVIDTPTAYAIGRGTYNVSLMTYDQGGVEFKTFIGLHDYVFLGISFDVQNLLGSGTPHPNIPGVAAKFKLFDGAAYFPAIAVGYDSFYNSFNDKMDNPRSFNNRIKYGPYMVLINPYYYLYHKGRGENKKKNKFNRMVYGPYAAFTSPIYILNSEQFISYGVRIPIQPYVELKDASYFFALDIPLGEYFRILAEVERMFWDFRNPDEWIYNFGVRFTYLEQLSIEIAISYEPGEKINRLLRVEYHGEF